MKAISLSVVDRQELRLAIRVALAEPTITAETRRNLRDVYGRLAVIDGLHGLRSELAEPPIESLGDAATRAVATAARTMHAAAAAAAEEVSLSDAATEAMRRRGVALPWRAP